MPFRHARCKEAKRGYAYFNRWGTDMFKRSTFPSMLALGVFVLLAGTLPSLAQHGAFHGGGGGGFHGGGAFHGSGSFGGYHQGDSFNTFHGGGVNHSHHGG